MPASGNLAVHVQSKDDNSFRIAVNIFQGPVESLNHSRSQYLEWNGVEQTAFFQNLPAGDSVYIAIDYRNNSNQAAYFDLCLLDPPCLPVIGLLNSTAIDCSDNTQYYADIYIDDLGNAASIDIVNFYDASIIYAQNVSSTGITRIGPFTVNSGPDIILKADNPLCDSDRLFINARSPNISNYLPCSAIDISSLLGTTYSYTQGDIDNTALDCYPTVPTGGCLESGVWPDNVHRRGSEWFTFTTPSSNLSLIHI